MLGFVQIESDRMPALRYHSTIELCHDGDCGLIGIGADFTIYAEEIYTENAWIAQHAIALDGSFIQTIDELYGEVSEVSPIAVTENTSKAQPGWQTIKTLNFAGPRHRGMRESERMIEMVRPFSLSEKLALVERLALPFAPPMLLGLAESYVLSEAEIERPHLYVICRRIRLAYALPGVELDDQQQPYDYDTQVIYLAHWFDRRSEEVSLIEALDSLPDAPLYRPMDCIIHGSYLFISDGGGTMQNNRIHIWQIE